MLNLDLRLVPPVELTTRRSKPGGHRSWPVTVLLQPMCMDFGILKPYVDWSKLVWSYSIQLIWFSYLHYFSIFSNRFSASRHDLSLLEVNSVRIYIISHFSLGWLIIPTNKSMFIHAFNKRIDLRMNINSQNRTDGIENECNTSSFMASCGKRFKRWLVS